MGPSRPRESSSTVRTAGSAQPSRGPTDRSTSARTTVRIGSSASHRPHNRGPRKPHPFLRGVHPRVVLGMAGQRVAEAELARRGMTIVARNARTRFGEIDLVCRDRAGYVFVEVKTRRAGSFVAAAEAVDRRQLKRIARLALGWLALRGEREARWRVVVAALTIGRSGTRVELLEATP